jgi:hypothetical protein
MIFGVGRDPNKHLAFGCAVHFCLDAALARMQVNSFFSELLPRRRSIDAPQNPNSSPPRSSAGSSACRFCAGPVPCALDVQESVDGCARAFVVVEVRQSGQAPQHQRADQQGDGTRSIDLT